jgi:hypothetical protein
MGRNQIVLSEQELHMLVEDSVRIYLQENGVDEDVMGGLKNVWQGAKNLNFNVGANYKAGNLASNFAKYAQQVQNAIEQMRQIASATKNNQVSTYLGQVSKTLQKTVGMFNQTAQKIAQGNGQNGQNAMSNFKLNQQQMGKMGYNNMLNNKQMKNYQQLQQNQATTGTTKGGKTATKTPISI